MSESNMAAAIQDLPVSGGADPYAKYRFVGNWFAFVILVASVGEIAWNASHPTARDFVGFWGAARLALAGHASAAYDIPALHAVQSAAASFGSANAEMPFPYPPAYLLLCIPFGLLSFPAGFAAWTLCTFAFYLIAARTLMPRSGWLAVAFPAVFANAAIGQNGFLTAGILMSGLALMERRPFTSGIVLGCLVIKPQLGLLLPIAFIAGRTWRPFLGAAISSIAILAIGTTVFGLGTTAAWLHQLPILATIMRAGLVGWAELASVYAASRQLGLSTGPALALHGLVALAAASAVWHIWSTSQDIRFRVAILCAATLLASPYLFFYDQLIVVPVFLLLARKEHPVLLATLWCLPLLQIAQIGGAATPVNLNVVTAIALTIIIYMRWRDDTSLDRGEARDCSLTIQQPSPVSLS